PTAEIRGTVFTFVNPSEVALDRRFIAIDANDRLNQEMFVPRLRCPGMCGDEARQFLTARNWGRPSSPDAILREQVHPLLLAAVVDAMTVEIERVQDRPLLFQEPQALYHLGQGSRVRCHRGPP